MTHYPIACFLVAAIRPTRPPLIPVGLALLAAAWMLELILPAMHQIVVH